MGDLGLARFLDLDQDLEHDGSDVARNAALAKGAPVGLLPLPGCGRPAKPLKTLVSPVGIEPTTL